MKNQTPQIEKIIDDQFNYSLLKNSSKDLPKLKIMKKEVSIVFIGTPEFSAKVLEDLINFCDTSPSTSHKNPTQFPTSEITTKPTFKIQAVLTAPQRLVGREQTLKNSPVYDVAQHSNIPVMTPEKIDQEFIKNHLGLLNANLFIVVSYGSILPQKFLDIPQLGSINIHPSLLPKYRGSSPIQAAVLNGDKITGASLMLMDSQMDHGPLISQTKEYKISDSDTYLTLSQKLAEISSKLLIETLPDFVGGKISPTPQDDSKSSYTWKTSETKQQAFVDLNNLPDQEALDRKIRAFYPEPGCWTSWNNRIIKFLPEGLVQMEGKKPTKLKDFLNGYPDFPIKSLK